MQRSKSGIKKWSTRHLRVQQSPEVQESSHFHCLLHMEQKHRSLLEQSKKVSLLANIRSRVRTVTDLYYPFKTKHEHSQVCRKEPRGQHVVKRARQVTSKPRCKNAGSVNSRHQLVLILPMDISPKTHFCHLYYRFFSAPLRKPIWTQTIVTCFRVNSIRILTRIH